MSQEITAYRARWVFPVIMPPIENGVVAVRDGKILEVASRDRWSGPITHDLGEVAIIPGLINAHTHLEFSELEKPLGHQGIPFAEWIELVIAHRRSRPIGKDREYIADGFRESIEAGVCAIGEMSTSISIESLSDLERTQTIVFYEMIGLAESQLDQRVEDIYYRLKNRSMAHGSRPGISPHATYTVRWTLLQTLVQIAAQERLPVAMHVAESPAEIELLADRSGPLREMLEKLGVWHDDAWPAVVSIADYLEVLATAPRALVVHGNYLTTRDMEIIAAHRDRMSVVYCPRTHAYFEHTPHAYPEMIKKGINVALGTDSRASNPDLSLFEEMRAVAKQERVSPEVALRMGTLNGAEALGLSNQFGSLKPGNVATLCVVNANPAELANHPHDALFADGTLCTPIERASR